MSGRKKTQKGFDVEQQHSLNVYDDVAYQGSSTA